MDIQSERKKTLGGTTTMKKIVSYFVLFSIIFVLAACGSKETSSEKAIKIGATAGPYSDQLKEGIIPILEEKGYNVEIVEFNDYVQPNNALNEGSIDANLYQNRNYLLNFNEEQGMDLVPAFAVPTAPIAFYSEKHDSLDDIENGILFRLETRLLILFLIVTVISISQIFNGFLQGDTIHFLQKLIVFL